MTYTDGITDAAITIMKCTANRLLNFLNAFKSDDNPIVQLLNTLNSFAKD